MAYGNYMSYGAIICLFESFFFLRIITVTFGFISDKVWLFIFICSVCLKALEMQAHIVLFLFEDWCDL